MFDLWLVGLRRDPKTGMTFASVEMFQAVRKGVVKGRAAASLLSGGGGAAGLLVVASANSVPAAAAAPHKGPGRSKKRKLGV